MIPPASDDTLAVFPLPGVLLLPEVQMPLHVFEPRYRNLVHDALEGTGEIGIIQPRESPPPPTADDVVADSALAEQPSLYDVGCVGLLEQHEHLDDGRYLILLRGERRFRSVQELDLEEGYRRLVVTYDEFDDAAEDDPVAPGKAIALLESVQSVVERANATLDVKRLRNLSPRCMVHTLAMGLPFSPAEKHALLESPTAATRLEAISALLEMGLDVRGKGDDAPLVAN